MSLLGEGLTSKVYLAKNKLTGELVAVKSLLKEIDNYEKFYVYKKLLEIYYK